MKARKSTMATLTKRMSPTLNSILNYWQTNKGIFAVLNNYNVPWKNEIEPDILDLEYIGNISGNKTISPLIAKMIQADGVNALTDVRLSQLALIIYNLNSLKWGKLWDTFNLEYNPISNYDMTEVESIDENSDSTRNNKGTVENSDTQHVNGSSSGDNTGLRYAFNSTTAKNTTGGEQSATMQSALTGSSTRTDNLIATDTEMRAINRSLKRSGNIGVTTSQQMIDSERKLWLWNIFYKVIFPDLDHVLTIDTYSNAPTYGVYETQGGGGTSTAIMKKLEEIGTKIDTNTNSINLSIDRLRVSTFDAIDGVTTRQY